MDWMDLRIRVHHIAKSAVNRLLAATEKSHSLFLDHTLFWQATKTSI